MNQAEIFSYILQRNQDLIAKATDGLSQTESVLQLPGESNCMNWVLGHIALYRDEMLASIRQKEQMSAAEVKLYSVNSKPITIASKSSSLERLLKLLVQEFEALSKWLESNPEGLQQKTPHDIARRRGATVVEQFTILCWHETHHVGELNALRELALVSLGKGWK